MKRPIDRDPAARLSQGRPEATRRWLALVFIAMSTMMVALDNTIVSIALPSTQAELGASDTDRQWMITAYTLTFGGLLLLGGRISDKFGSRRAFLYSLVGFAVASAAGGAAVSFWMLVAARASQGAFAAVLAPTALSLVSVMFNKPRERARAFAIYGAVAGSGAAVGLILGGLLTEYFSWRWCLYVNIPIAIAAAIGGAAVLTPSRQRSDSKLDLRGALLVTGGLVGLVYACSAAGAYGLGATQVVVSFAVAAALLVAFFAVQARVPNPLLPMRLLRDRSLVGSNLALALTVAGQLGVFLFLTYYLQTILGYTPVQTGLAFLPMTLAILISSGAIASRLLPRLPPRALMTPGLLTAALAVGLFTRLRVDSPYLTSVLPALVLLGAGIGCVFVPAISTATHRVPERDAGVASGLVNTSQMMGGSVGTALLNTVAATGAGLVHGYTRAAAWGAGILVVAALASAVLVNARSLEQTHAERSTSTP